MIPTSAQGQMLQSVSASDVSLVKKLEMQLLFAWLWRLAEMPIQAAATPNAPRVRIEWSVR